ncbi:hypothetical protein M408DRAFT_330157 [Serendipita vermifera MAFF 305830]|uniref:Uncharacterized protein n=1 Tax=Serendipita vermifera MAFF 305830 TaxID=933852 RepID=A0A0C2XDT6_SERVB|nr:hypothetical protein M408DRAFT_330157 [Serendipita vermifera MAFF 305830]
MIASGTDISTLDPSVNPQDEKEILIRARVEPLEVESKEEIKAIKLKAQAHRSELEKQISLSYDIEQADIQICKIRLSGQVARIRNEVYGESQSQIVGPIRGLPVEMLSYVFRYHVESGSSPWILAKVSKLWMHTALSTPQLWSHIRVGIQGSSYYNQPTPVAYVVNGRKEYSIGHKQDCSDTMQVDAALRRSGEVPLSFEFVCPSWTQHRVVNSTFLQILYPPISERVENLDIKEAYITTGTIPDDTPIGPFPRLLSLKLPKTPSDWVARLLKAVSETSHRLEAISLGGVRTGLVECRFWSHIRRLTFDNVTYRFDGLSDVIERLGALEHLEDVPSGWPNETTPMATCEHIRQVMFTCNPAYLGRLCLPSLESLNLALLTGNAPPVNGGDQLIFPHVVTLELDVAGNRERWSRYLAHAFPKVEDLTLERPQDDEMTIAVLKSMPRIRKVTLTGSSGQEYGLEFLESLRSSNEPLLCPNLETLLLGNGNRRFRLPKGKAGPLIKKLVKARQQIGKPLRELTVHWRFRNEVVNYV